MENVIFFLFHFFPYFSLADPNMSLNNYMYYFFLMSHYLPGAEVLGMITES